MNTFSPMTGPTPSILRIKAMADRIQDKTLREICGEARGRPGTPQKNSPRHPRRRARTGGMQAPLPRAKKKGPGFLPGPVGGDDLLSRALDAVPSALAVLTSLFGMGRGGTRRFRHHVPRAPDRTPSTRAGNTEHSFRGKPRAISTARLCRRRLYTCGLSTSSSSTALMEASSSGEFRT